MKKNILLLFTLSCLSILYSQNGKSVICVYKVYTPFDLKKTEVSNVSKSIAKTKPLSYVLAICDNKSKFSLIDNMEIDDVDMMSLNFRKILSFGGKYVETSVNDDEIFERNESLGAKFAIKTKISDYKWNITTESKMIDNYSCLKATCQIKGRGRGGAEIDKEIIAYFCPALNYQFGPREFCGLPGLILEVVVDNSVIGIESISFSEKSAKDACVQGDRNGLNLFNSYMDFYMHIYPSKK
jgi:GLPGLI family protein